MEERKVGREKCIFLSVDVGIRQKIIMLPEVAAGGVVVGVAYVFKCAV